MIQISPRWGNTLVKTNPGTNEPQQIETTLKEQNTPKIRPNTQSVKQTKQSNPDSNLRTIKMEPKEPNGLETNRLLTTRRIKENNT